MNKRSALIKWYRIENFFYRHRMKLFAKLFYGLIYLLFNCVIPPSCKIGSDCDFGHSVGIVLHHETEIGRGTKIYQNVTIGGGRRVICENCYIGAGAVILADVGSNVKIGANAVVVDDIPDNVTAVGVPARIIKETEG